MTVRVRVFLALALALVFVAAVGVAAEVAEEDDGLIRVDGQGNLHVDALGTVFVDGVDVSGSISTITSLQEELADANSLITATLRRTVCTVNETTGEPSLPYSFVVHSNLNPSHYAGAGGAFDDTGRYLCVAPQDVGNVFLIDTYTEEYEVIPITGLSGPTGFFPGGFTLAQNKKLYAFPFGPTTMLEFDPVAKSTSLIEIGEKGFFGQVAANNGKIYGIPWNSGHDSFFVYDTNSGTAETLPYAGPLVVEAFATGVLGPNGKVYGMPHRLFKMLVIDPATGVVDFDSITVPNDNSQQTMCFQGVVGPGGKIFGLPAQQRHSILVFDPSTNATAWFPLSTQQPVGGSWRGLAYVPGTGKLYAAPYAHNSVLIVDTTTNTTSAYEIDFTNSVPDYTMFLPYASNIVLRDDNLLYCPFGKGSTTLVFDPIQVHLCT